MRPLSSCAGGTLPAAGVAEAWSALKDLGRIATVRELTALLSTP